MDVEYMKNEQRQELFEAIRHFSKYKALKTLDESLSIPAAADGIHNSMMALYEEHYEKTDENLSNK